MGTKQVVLQGEASWAKVFEQNRDMKGFENAFVPFDGAYTIDIKLDKFNFDTLAATGAAKASKIKQKEADKFGEATLKFTRKHKDRFDWSSGAPVVLKEDGSPWNYVLDGVIPNGSKVTIGVDVYTTSKATGTRLAYVHVTERADMEEKPVKIENSFKTTSDPVDDSVLF